jgi:hypothetical protein
LGKKRPAICRTGATDNQLDEAAAQAGGHRNPCGFASAGLAADLHDEALAFVRPPAAWENLALRQEGGPFAADVDKRCTERRQKPRHSAEVNAAGFAAVATLDVQLNRNSLFEQHRAPLTRARRYQELAIQFGR